MKKGWKVLLAGLAGLAANSIDLAHADLIYGGGLYDFAGNGVTSQSFSGTRNPLDVQTIFSGAAVDPRARTWTLLNTTDSVNSVQSGSWTTGRTWTLSNTTDSVNSVQSGTWTVQQGTPPWSVSQSGTWTTGRTWNLSSASDSVSATQGTSPWVTNETQIAGNAINTGTGASGTGTQRVAVSTDSSITVNASSNIIGNVRIDQTTPGTTNGIVVNSSSLPTGAANATNQSTEITALGTINTSLGTTLPRNVSQIGGNSINTGTGTAGTGTQRVAVSSDSSITANAGTNLNTSLLALDSTVAKDASLGTLNTSVNTLLKPASTLAAVTTLGSITSALPSGTNLLGKVGIDQTTPGTTNGVVVNSSTLPTGAATATIQSSQLTQETTTATNTTSIQSTSNSTAVNTNTIAANQTNGTQRTLISDLVGNLQPSADAPARTLYARLNDGTNSTVVKAGSTQSLLTDTALVVTGRPDNVGTPTQTSVSCAGTSTTLLAAGAATMFLFIRNPTTATQTVWINMTGSAAVAAAPSVDLSPGSEADFFAEGASFLPTAQINCISGGTASTVAVVYK